MKTMADKPGRRALAIAGVLLACAAALAPALAFFTADAAWASGDDVCAYAYLEPLDDGSGLCRLVLREHKLPETGGSVYRDLGELRAGGYVSGDVVEPLPWEGYESGIAEVSIGEGTIRPTETAYWFYGFEHMRSIDLSDNLSGVDFSNVTDLSSMFAESEVEEVDFGRAAIENVTRLEALFGSCESLRSVDLSAVSAPADAVGEDAFANCPALKTVTIGSGFKCEEALEGLFEEGRTWIPQNVDDSSCKTPAEMIALAAGASEPVTFSAQPASGGVFAVENASEHTLYIRAGNPRLDGGESLLGLVFSSSVLWGNEDKRASFEHVMIEDPVSMRGYADWFAEFESLESVSGLSNLDTSSADSLSGLFSGCSSLESIDLTGFDTRGVADLSRVFEDCSSLKAVDVSGFDTSSATDLSSLFAGCSSLTEVDISSFDLSSAEDLSDMFHGCKALKAIEGTDAFANTKNATSFSSMFQECARLSGIGLSMFDAGNVTDMSYMFAGCSALTSFEFPHIDVSNLGSTLCMFADCDELAEFAFDVDLSNASITANMLASCKKLTTVKVSAQTRFPSNRTSMLGGMWSSSDDGRVRFGDLLPSWVEATYTRVGEAAEDPANAYALLDASGKLVVSASEPSGAGTRFEVNGGGYESAGDVPWHDDRTRIKTVAVESADVSANMSYWFDGCQNLTSVEVGSANAAAEYSQHDVMRMCADCPALKSVKFSFGYVRNAEEAFAGCSALERFTVAGGKDYYISTATRMFAGCSSLAALDLSGFSGMGNAAGLFDGCTALANVNLPERVSSLDYSGMFRMCTALESVDVGGFFTENATDFSEMFRSCSSLSELDLSAFDTGKALSLKRMLHGCRSLGKVTLGKRFTFRGDTFARLAGSEFPVGAWQEVDASGSPADELRAYASDSIPNGKAAAYARVDETTPGLVVESLRGDTVKGSAKYTIETTLEQQPDGTVEAVSDYIVDDGDGGSYAATDFSIGDAAKASSVKSITNKTVTKQTVNSVVSKKVTSITVGPQVAKIKARAFAGAPSVKSVTVCSDKLTTKGSVCNCLLGSNVSKVSYNIRTTMAKGLKVKAAFEKWSGKRKK